MKITIQGQDYTAALDGAYPLTIARKLNEPSVCRMWLSLPGDGSLAHPVRGQSVAVTGDDATAYFTGYIATSPMPEFAGMATEGPRYRFAIQALSDEILLDQVLMAPSKGTAGQTAGALMESLVLHSGSSALSMQGLTLNAPISNFVPEAGAQWSASAGSVANQSRAAYRALNGKLSLEQIPGCVHTLNETDGSLNLAGLALTSSVKRGLANDVTVCGEHEPVAYVTEYFLGDGTTTEFYLAADPFVPAASKAQIIRESFHESALNLTVWSVASGCNTFALGAGGLTMSGGNGADGQAVLSWIDPVEMGGTLLLEATGISLAAGSAGVIAGMYAGLEVMSACVAGFQVTAQPGTGAVSVQPLIQGTAQGASYALSAGNQYAVRIRVHCAENQRSLQMYRSWGDDGAITNGGTINTAGALLQFEVQEYVNGVASTPVTLYDGSIASLPAACQIVAASSLNLQGSMRSLNLTNLGSGWVVSTPANGTTVTRRVGTLAEAAECHVQSAGKLTFYGGFAPPVGEQITVSYRTVGRALGRAVNAANQAALAQAGLSGTSAWIGTVSNPPARSSADCRNAAMTMVQAASSVSALWSGKYRGTKHDFAADVWPGDGLQLSAPSAGMNAQVVVRTAELSYRGSYPDLVEYEVAFANDWADDLAIKTSATVPADAWLPSAIAPTVLGNLAGLTVTAMTGTTVTIYTGVAAPSGGGFEIRRRDFGFMPGEDSDLVMRGAQSNLTFARESESDRFYIRMYDGSTPPNYSEFSAALFINLPMGS